jgi:hypothetical protein
VDPHRCDTDPDPNFYVDADPHADPTPSFTLVIKSEFFLLLVTAFPVYNVLSFSSVSNVS